MKFLLITETLSPNFESSLIKELKNLGIEVDVLELSSVKKIHYKKYDLVYSRIMQKFGFFGYYVSKAFEIRGCKFVDPVEKIFSCQNKFLSYQLLKNKIPLPETELLLPKAKPKLNKIKVVKPIFGRAGYLVYKISKYSPKLLTLYLRRKLNHYLTYPFIIQEYVEFERLIRVCVLNKKPIFAITSRKKSWRDAIYKNAEKYEFDEKLLNYSKIAAKEFGLRIAFLDFFKVKDDYIFNELNYCCDLPKINNILGYNFHRKVAEFFIKLV